VGEAFLRLELSPHTPQVFDRYGAEVTHSPEFKVSALSER
jgi:hypothetical protein